MNEDVVKGLLFATKPNCIRSISGWELAFETKDMRRGTPTTGQEAREEQIMVPFHEYFG